MVGHVGRWQDVRVAGVAGQQRGVKRSIGQFHVNDVDLHQLGLARVKAALEHGKAGQIGGLDAKGLKNGGLQRVVGVGQGQFDFSQSQHESVRFVACGYQARGPHHKGLRLARPPQGRAAGRGGFKRASGRKETFNRQIALAGVVVKAQHAAACGQLGQFLCNRGQRRA